MNYLVTTIYSGALHISPMRLFPTVEEAWAYYDEITVGHQVGYREQGRVYEVFSDAPPKLLKKKS